MSAKGLDNFLAHRKALELFEFVVEDIAPLAKRFELTKLVAQQLSSADSIAANIEEGYGRGTKKDYAHFLLYARGSTQETLGRYNRLKHWIDATTVEMRIKLCKEIIAILTTTIKTLRNT